MGHSVASTQEEAHSRQEISVSTVSYNLNQKDFEEILLKLARLVYSELLRQVIHTPSEEDISKEERSLWN